MPIRTSRFCSKHGDELLQVYFWWPDLQHSIGSMAHVAIPWLQLCRVACSWDGATCMLLQTYFWWPNLQHSVGSMAHVTTTWAAQRCLLLERRP